MAYSDNNDLLKELTNEELIQLSGGSGSINIDRTDSARNKADTLINANLYGIYEVPFAIVPEIIKQLSIDLTLYYLYLYSKKEAFLPVPIIERKSDAIIIINKLAKKEIKLDNIEMIYSNNGKPIFNRKELNKLLEN